MPSKWMIGGRVELAKFLKEMKEDTHISKLTDYQDDRLIFPSAHIDGGVCYFLWDSKKLSSKIDYKFYPLTGGMIQSDTLFNDYSDHVIRNANVRNILDTINKDKAFKSFATIVSKTRPFGLRKDIFNVPENYPDANISEKEYEKSVKLYGVKGFKGGAKRTSAYVSEGILSDKYSALNKYKIFFTTTYSSNAKNAPAPILAGPREACTETFLLVGPFENETQMNNCNSYMQTKLFKFLLYYGHGTMQVNQGVFQTIPLVDFNENWDDKKVFEKYKFSKEELDYIDTILSDNK